MTLRRLSFLLVCLSLFSGCQASGIRGFWETQGIDYSDVDAARNRFASFAEKAVHAPMEEACAELDVLFDLLKEDELAYYLYTGWMDGAFYSPLSPCRNADLYGKFIERVVADGVLSPNEYEPYLRQNEWMGYNREGEDAVIPGVVLDGRRTLVLLLDPQCPSCRNALSTLAESPQWKGLRHLAVVCGYGSLPDVEGWEFVFPENAATVFDPHLTPVYFVVSADGKVEIPYTNAN